MTKNIERRLTKLEDAADLRMGDPNDPLEGMVPEYDPNDPESVRRAHEKVFEYVRGPWTEERIAELGRYYGIDASDPEQLRLKCEEIFGQPEQLRRAPPRW